MFLGRPLSSPFKSSEPTPQPISQTNLSFPHVSLTLLLLHVYTYIILILVTFHLSRYLYQYPLQEDTEWCIKNLQKESEDSLTFN